MSWRTFIYKDTQNISTWMLYAWYYTLWCCLPLAYCSPVCFACSVSLYLCLCLSVALSTIRMGAFFACCHIEAYCVRHICTEKGLLKLLILYAFAFNFWCYNVRKKQCYCSFIFIYATKVYSLFFDDVALLCGCILLIIFHVALFNKEQPNDHFQI